MHCWLALLWLRSAFVTNVISDGADVSQSFGTFKKVRMISPDCPPSFDTLDGLHHAPSTQQDDAKRMSSSNILCSGKDTVQLIVVMIIISTRPKGQSFSKGKMHSSLEPIRSSPLAYTVIFCTSSNLSLPLPRVPLGKRVPSIQCQWLRLHHHRIHMYYLHRPPSVSVWPQKREQLRVWKDAQHKPLISSLCTFSQMRFVPEIRTNCATSAVSELHSYMPSR